MIYSHISDIVEHNQSHVTELANDTQRSATKSDSDQVETIRLTVFSLRPSNSQGRISINTNAKHVSAPVVYYQQTVVTPCEE